MMISSEWSFVLNEFDRHLTHPKPKTDQKYLHQQL